ncbi:hypothetical protein B6N60_03399 [Richelia sinica FACHB-800]|uniref:Uncharacterized protein n=1 Tax=Richelia sinica FACHB-800 TaxID=1357546 RepID=A0A975TAY0_9NOST|nr:hypothetical protein B6N60_03399 [Richelia sinica FACHB-800]
MIQIKMNHEWLANNLMLFNTYNFFIVLQSITQPQK